MNPAAPGDEIFLIGHERSTLMSGTPLEVWPVNRMASVATAPRETAADTSSSKCGQDSTKDVVADFRNRSLFAGADRFHSLPDWISGRELQVDVADSLQIAGIGFLQVGGFIRVAAWFLGGDVAASDIDGDIQQHDQRGTRECEHAKLNAFNRPQQFVAFRTFELGTLVRVDGT